MVYYTIIYIYPSRQSPDFRWAKMRSGVFWRLTVDCRPMFPPILDEALVGRRFLCRNNQVKSFVELYIYIYPPFFMTFSSVKHQAIVARWSTNSRPILEESYNLKPVEPRLLIGCQCWIEFRYGKRGKRSNEILTTSIKLKKKPNFFYRKTVVLSVKFSLQWLRL